MNVKDMIFFKINGALSNPWKLQEVEQQLWLQMIKFMFLGVLDAEIRVHVSAKKNNSVQFTIVKFIQLS